MVQPKNDGGGGTQLRVAKNFYGFCNFNFWEPYLVYGLLHIEERRFQFLFPRYKSITNSVSICR